MQREARERVFWLMRCASIISIINPLSAIGQLLSIERRSKLKFTIQQTNEPNTLMYLHPPAESIHREEIPNANDISQTARER
jgi:hypothetical protein